MQSLYLVEYWEENNDMATDLYMTVVAEGPDEAKEIVKKKRPLARKLTIITPESYSSSKKLKS